MNLLSMIQNVCDSCDVPWNVQSDRAKKLINAKLTELSTLLKLSQPLVTLTVTIGVGDYSLATLGVVQVRDVFYQPVGQQQASPPLEQTSASRIDDIRSRSVSNTYPMMYAIIGVDTLALGPVPSDAGTLSVRGTAAGSTLNSDGDEPTLLPDEYHDVVWLGAAENMALIMAPKAYPALHAQYVGRLADLRSWLQDLGGERPIRMQRRGDSIPNRDPSIYPPVQSY